jgi:pilus assembly protein Flp/PilA
MRSVQFIKKLLRDTRGTSAVEYGLILSLVVIGLVGAIAGVADQTHKMWSFVESEAAKAQGGGN